MTKSFDNVAHPSSITNESYSIPVIYKRSHGIVVVMGVGVGVGRMGTHHEEHRVVQYIAPEEHGS